MAPERNSFPKYYSMENGKANLLEDIQVKVKLISVSSFFSLNSSIVIKIITGFFIILEYFNQNPKFFIDLKGPTFSSKSAQCSVVISLMQCFGNRQHAKDNQTLLGFKIFKCADIVSILKSSKSENI